MHDAIGDDLSAVVLPTDLPRTSVGHSNGLVWKVHDLRQLFNLVYTLYAVIHRDLKDRIVFLDVQGESTRTVAGFLARVSSRPTIHRELKVEKAPLSDPEHLDPRQRLALQPFEEGAARRRARRCFRRLGSTYRRGR